jgi:hypothetical protein
MIAEWKALPGNIYLFTFERPRLLAQTFLRFQEYYESPVFKGKIFTLNEFNEWYGGIRNTEYVDDWSGFNVPDKAFDAFIAGKFDPLSVEENTLLSKVATLKKPFYVIGAIKGDTGTILHETAHALFYLSELYRREVRKILKGFNTKRIESFLEEKGYDHSVMLDEVNAYLLFDGDLLEDEGIINPAETEEIQKNLHALFEHNFDVKLLEN